MPVDGAALIGESLSPKDNEELVTLRPNRPALQPCMWSIPQSSSLK